MGNLGIMASAIKRAAPATYREAVLADSPISYWRLGESSGVIADDEMFAHVGTYVSTVTFSQTGALIGDANTAVLFSGTPSEYVNVAGFTSVPPLVTIEAWVKGTSFNDNGLMGWYDSGNNATCLVYLSSTAITFYIKNLTNDTVFGTPITDGLWHHVVGTYDGSVANLYFDGALVAGPITKTASGGTSSYTFKIGQYGTPDGTAIAATIDEVAVYSTALSAARVLAHYHAAGY